MGIPAQPHIFSRGDHEIISIVFLSCPLIQEGQLSVTGESMRTTTGKLLRGLSPPRKFVSRLTDWLYINLRVLTGP